MFGLLFQLYFETLTPSDDAELEDVSAYVGVEDFDQSDVHVDGLQPHPGEGGQQEVVQKDGHGEAQPLAVQARQPAVQQEDHVEEQQGRAEVHQDLGGVVAPQFSAGRRDEDVTCSRRGGRNHQTGGGELLNFTVWFRRDFKGSKTCQNHHEAPVAVRPKVKVNLCGVRTAQCCWQ